MFWVGKVRLGALLSTFLNLKQMYTVCQKEISMTIEYLFSFLKRGGGRGWGGELLIKEIMILESSWEQIFSFKSNTH